MTILVVDDSVTMRMSLKTTLSMSGFLVETANHGQAAPERLKSGIKPNLIITDVNMHLQYLMEKPYDPGWDGCLERTFPQILADHLKTYRMRSQKLTHLAVSGEGPTSDQSRPAIELF